MKLIPLASALVLAGCASAPLKTVRSAPPEQTAPDLVAHKSRVSSVGLFVDQAPTVKAGQQ